MIAVAAVLLVLLPAPIAGAPDLPRVEDARPLLLAALRAPDGEARGLLEGELAQAITRQFEASGPIHIDVTTLHRYRQIGCSRLNVAVWQEGVTLPGAAGPQTQRIDFGIDYCLDGRPPASRERRP